MKEDMEGEWTLCRVEKGMHHDVFLTIRKALEEYSRQRGRKAYVVHDDGKYRFFEMEAEK